MTNWGSEMTPCNAPQTPLLCMVLALFVAPAASGDVWLPLPNGDLVGPHGGLLLKEPYGYMDNRTGGMIVVERSTALNINTGTSYVGGNGLYSGTDGSTGYVNGHGDVYEFEHPHRDLIRLGDDSQP